MIRQLKKDDTKSKLFYGLHVKRALVYLPLFLFIFYISSYINVLISKSFYIPSGGPSFSKIVFPFFTIHLPAFTAPIPTILTNESNPIIYIYLLAQSGTLLVVSYIFLFIAAFLIFNKFFIAWLSTLLFHCSKSIQQLFWSAPTFDFFPKIHLTELWLITIAYLVQRSQRQSLARNKRLFVYYCILLSCGMVAVYIRNSSFPILISIVLTIIHFHKIRLRWLICAFAILVVSVSFRLKQMGAFSYLYFFTSSIPVSSQATLGNVATLPKSSVPLNDGLLSSFITTSYPFHQIIIDKFFFSSIWFSFKMELFNLLQSSLFFDTFQYFGITYECAILFSFLLAVTSLSLLVTVLPRELLKQIMVFLYINLIFVFLSRFSPQQEMHLAIISSLGHALLLYSIFHKKHCNNFLLDAAKKFYAYLFHKSNSRRHDVSLYLVGFSMFLLFLPTIIVDNEVKRPPVDVNEMEFSYDMNQLLVLLPQKVQDRPNNYALRLSVESKDVLFRGSFLPMSSGMLTFYVPISDKTESEFLFISLDMFANKPKITFLGDLPPDMHFVAKLVERQALPSVSLVSNLLEVTPRISRVSYAPKTLEILNTEASCPEPLQIFCYVSKLTQLKTKPFSNYSCWRSLSHSLILHTSYYDSSYRKLFSTVKFANRGRDICIKTHHSFVHSKSELFAWSSLLANPKLEVRQWRKI